MLNSRAARNEALAWDENDDGEVVIMVERQENLRVRLLSKIFYIPQERKITLDEVGTEVWQMCNGKTSVAQMIERLGKKYQLNRKEAEVSLLSYLKTLGQKRFVGFLIIEGDKGKAERGAASGKKWG